ncbi:MAG: hypothetical protein ACYC4D_08375 [Thermoleophilia bacterium]
MPAILGLIALAWLANTASAYGAAGPLSLDTGSFGINAERPHEDIYNSDILATADQYWNSYSIECNVSIHETSAASATAGLIVGWDDSDENAWFFGIYPNEGRWRLYKPGFSRQIEGVYDFGLEPASYHLKAMVADSTITVFINGQAVSSFNSGSPVGGRVGLQIRGTDSQFSNVKVNGAPQQLSSWNASHYLAWSGIINNAARGNVLLDPGLLASPELSPKLDERFAMMDAMGARYVRFRLSWAEVQPQSASQPYSWLYADAFAIAAQRNNLDIVPVLVDAPRWAVSPEFRNSPYYKAYPPVDSNENFDTTSFSQFAGAAVGRYKRGGQLAGIMGWSSEGHGQAGYFEVGPEFNLGALYEKLNGQWVMAGAGWLGGLSEFVDLLKAGHDAVKGSCPSCLVLNGAPTDDTITNYYIGDNPSRNDGNEPYLDDARLHNPDGTLAWRQTVWQGVNDLYEEIERRPPPDNVPDRYFDVLNIHTFMWKGYMAEWPFTADRYVNCSFYSSECRRQWYDKRFEEVIRVMHEHNDNRDIWLTETGFASARPGNDYMGFLGFLSEDKQAQALQNVFSSAAGFPEVKKVFWWQAYDSYYTGNLGLIREDLSTKPSYDKYAWMTGKKLEFSSKYDFTWYDNVSAANWILVANPASAAADAWFDLSIAGQLMTLPALPGLSPGQVPAGDVLYARFPDLMAGPVNVACNSRSGAFSSQRTLWAGNSLEEVTGTDSARLSNHFFWPWYDERTPGYLNWVLVSNPAATPVYYRIRIAGNDVASGTLAGGAIVTPHFPGLIGGPVEVSVWADSLDGRVPAEVMASQRVLSNYGTAFNELPGIPAAELSDSYLWTWYDQRSPGFADWVLIANPGDTAVSYQIKIGGVTQPCGTCIIPAHDKVTLQFPGEMNGPVEVIASGNVIASQRITSGPSFGEVPGYRKSALTNTYYWTWYDQSQTNVYNWVMVAKPDPADITPVYYKVMVGGVPLQPCTEIPAAGRDTPVFPDQIGGPVEVRGYLDSGCETTPTSIMASQRVLWKGYFNETLGTVLE